MNSLYKCFVHQTTIYAIKLRQKMKIHSFKTYYNQIVYWTVYEEINSFKQFVNWFTIKKFVIKVLKFVTFYLRLWDSKSIRYLRKLIIFEFITTIKFSKDWLKIFLGAPLTLLYLRFHYICVHTKRVVHVKSKCIHVFLFITEYLSTCISVQQKMK